MLWSKAGQGAACLGVRRRGGGELGSRAEKTLGSGKSSAEGGEVEVRTPGKEAEERRGLNCMGQGSEKEAGDIAHQADPCTSEGRGLQGQLA